MLIVVAPLLATAAVVGRVLPPARHAPVCACAFSDDVSLEALRSEQAAFVEERDWAQFHTPRSLALAMVGEVGEVCELLQWRSDESPPGLPDWTPAERTALADELADVLSYVIRLADVTNIDLADAFVAKLAKNRAKYPADAVRGSAAKYTEYRSKAREAAAVEADETESSAEETGSTADTTPIEMPGGEWGTPDWVADAYARATSRVYGDERQAPPAMPPPTPTDAAPEPAPDGASKLSPQQRARKKVEELEEQLAASRRAAEGGADASAADGVEVESLDDLWGLMEFGDGTML